MLIQHLFQILEVMIKLVNRMISFKRDNRLDVSVDVEPGFVQVPLHEINRPENYTTATIAAHAYKCTVSYIENTWLKALTFHSVLKQVIKKNAHNRRLLSNRVAFLQKSVRYTWSWSLVLHTCWTYVSNYIKSDWFPASNGHIVGTVQGQSPFAGQHHCRPDLLLYSQTKESRWRHGKEIQVSFSSFFPWKWILILTYSK